MTTVKLCSFYTDCRRCLSMQTGLAIISDVWSPFYLKVRCTRWYLQGYII